MATDKFINKFYFYQYFFFKNPLKVKNEAHFNVFTRLKSCCLIKEKLSNFGINYQGKYTNTCLHFAREIV